MAFGRIAGMALPLIAATLAATPGLAEESGRCGMYPDAVYATLYAWSDCLLRDIGEKPLWHGVTHRDDRQQIRFTFIQGHAAYTKVIDFAERPDRTGILTFTHAAYEDGVATIRERRRYKVSAADVAKLDALAVATGNWAFTTGSWDGDEMYMHCQVLDMERVNADGYRYSSVNIGCNHPDKLMPLVDFLTGLAKLQPSADGRLY